MSGVRQSLQNFKTAVSVNHSVSKSDTISAQVNKIPAKQEKQNQWKVNHYEGFQRSGNRAIKKCTRCGKSPIHGRKDCPAKEAECRKCFVKGLYAAVCRSKKTLQRLAEEEDVILGVITAGDSRKSEIEGNSLSQLSGTPRPMARKNLGQCQKG